MLRTALSIARQIRAARPDVVTWMSFEPLSWNMAQVVSEFPAALKWAVIGAASRGKVYYQPETRDVARLLAALDEFDVPVFFKGNLSWKPWREEYPHPVNGE